MFFNCNQSRFNLRKRQNDNKLERQKGRKEERNIHRTTTRIYLKFKVSCALCIPCKASVLGSYLLTHWEPMIGVPLGRAHDHCSDCSVDTKSAM